MRRQDRDLHQRLVVGTRDLLPIKRRLFARASGQTAHLELGQHEIAEEGRIVGRNPNAKRESAPHGHGDHAALNGLQIGKFRGLALQRARAGRVLAPLLPSGRGRTVDRPAFGGSIAVAFHFSSHKR
jgi:hypothetical protein